MVRLGKINRLTGKLTVSSLTGKRLMGKRRSGQMSLENVVRANVVSVFYLFNL
jgi:3-dehydroquinate dehydratase